MLTVGWQVILFPVAGFGFRVPESYFSNGRLVVRKTPLLDFGHRNEENLEIARRWLTCRPMHHTDQESDGCTEASEYQSEGPLGTRGTSQTTVHRIGAPCTTLAGAPKKRDTPLWDASGKYLLQLARYDLLRFNRRSFVDWALRRPSKRALLPELED